MAGYFPDFQERQRFAPRVIVPFAIVLPIVAMVGGAALHFAAGMEAWAALAFAAVVGTIPLPLLLLRLIIEVRDEGLLLHFAPIRRRLIPWGDIAEAKATAYEIRKIGGWGVRLGRDGRTCYTASGFEGVDLTLKDGERVLVGSREAEELAAAIQTKLGRR